MTNISEGGAKRHRPMLWSALLALAVLAAACGSDSDNESSSTTQPDSTVTTGASAPSNGDPDDPLAPQPLEERVSLVVSSSGRSESNMNVLLAIEMGEFEKENLDVEWVAAPATDSLALVAQGQRIDVAVAGINTGLLNLIADGAEIRGIVPVGAPSQESDAGVWIRRDALAGDEFEPSDLYGVTVMAPNGAATGSIGYTLDSLIESDPDFDPDELQFGQMSFPDSALALVNGGIDAALLLEPVTVPVREDGCCVLIPNTYPRLPGGFFVAGPSLLGDENREVVKAFVRAVERTRINYLDDYHDPAFVDRVATALAIETEDVLSGIQQDFFGTLPDGYEQYTNTSQEYFRTLGDLNYDGLLPLTQLYDNSYYEEMMAGR